MRPWHPFIHILHHILFCDSLPKNNVLQLLNRRGTCIVQQKERQVKRLECSSFYKAPRPNMKPFILRCTVHVSCVTKSKTCIRNV